MTETLKLATFAGGCFWCTESAFADVKGIHEIVSGYIGGHVENPTYEQVCSGSTGHYEAVQISFDPDSVSYESLLEIFFRQIDPTDGSGSFVDRGTQYQSAVFYHDDAQKAAVLDIIENINNTRIFERPVVTKVLEAPKFYPAEDYHQQYHKTNAQRYKYYRAASGRDIFIEQNLSGFNKVFNSD